MPDEGDEINDSPGPTPDNLDDLEGDPKKLLDSPPEDEQDAGDQAVANDTVPELPLLEEVATTLLSAFGELTLHFPSRDVVLVVDGGGAASVLDLFARRLHRTKEPFIPGRSSMANAWFATDLNEALAISWWPGLPKRPSRTIIDPVPPERPWPS